VAEPAGYAVGDRLTLWFVGDPARPALIGELQLVSAGKGVSLTYAPSWLASGFPLSEDLPLVGGEFLPRHKGMAAGAVDDARPDRWGERVIQFLDKPRRLSLMEYLYYAGDDRFGALGVSTSATDYLPRRNGPLPRHDKAQALAIVMGKVNAKEPVSDLERRLATAGGSFGGAKPKALIEIDGAEWVIKFFNGEPVDAPLIEHAAMTLAAAAGIRVAETRVVALQGENAVAVRRFDRVGGARLHALSAGTALRALAAAGQEPELGYPQLAQLLRRAGPTTGGENARQMRELFRRMVFNILIDNTDDHEKNHALLLTEASRLGKLSLAPAYDVLPTNSGQGMQEFVVGTQGRDSTLSNAMSQSELFGLTTDEAAAEVSAVIAVVDRWTDHFAAAGVSAADIDSLAQQIDGEALRAQRREFDAANHRPAPAAPRRRGSRFQR
jgi:serine/threonine-protein kinase HipA